MTHLPNYLSNPTPEQKELAYELGAGYAVDIICAAMLAKLNEEHKEALQRLSDQKSKEETDINKPIWHERWGWNMERLK